MYAAPLAVHGVALLKFPDSAFTHLLGKLTFTSPFAAAFSLPLHIGETAAAANWTVFFGYLAFYGLFNLGMLFSIVEFFNIRWRASSEQ